MRLACAVVLCAGCGRVGFDPLAADSAAPVEAPVLAWSLVLGGSGAQVATSVAATGSDGFVIGGHTDVSIDLGGGPLPHVGAEDGLIASFTADGVHRWSRTFGSSGEDKVFDVAVDAAGNVYATGRVAGAVDFGGGVRIAGGGDDMFVASYAPDGSHRWSLMFGDNQNGDIGFGIAADAHGNVYVTGWFTGTIVFGDGARASTGGQDVFLLALDGAGATRFSRAFGGLLTTQGHKVAVDPDGRIALTGVFNGSFDAGGGEVQTAGDHDVFTVVTSATGATSWSRIASSIGSDNAIGLAFGADRAVHVTGYHAGPLDVGTGQGAWAGGTDGFVVRFDPDGTPAWLRTVGGPDADRLDACVVDSRGTLVLSGQFYSPTLELGETVLTNRGNDDPFLLALHPDGSIAWATSFGTPNAESIRDLAIGIDDVLYAVGVFNSPLDFGDGTRTPVGADIFVLRYVPR